MDINKFHQSLSKIMIFFKKVPTPGLLLVSGNGKDVNNVMTIGWIQIGILWKEPAVSIAVRPSRYSYKLLQEFDEFTINSMPEKYDDTLAACGAKSGSFCDKFKETQLQFNKSSSVSTYSIKEAENTMECKILYRTNVNPDNLNDLIMARYYANQDYHEIITASILRIKY
jgi:flavin reductase (DIM6/NTAB) family NADH-FMN oxidoreductase RutF